MVKKISPDEYSENRTVVYVSIKLTNDYRKVEKYRHSDYMSFEDRERFRNGLDSLISETVTGEPDSHGYAFIFGDRESYGYVNRKTNKIGEKYEGYHFGSKTTRVEKKKTVADFIKHDFGNNVTKESFFENHIFEELVIGFQVQFDILSKATVPVEETHKVKKGFKTVEETKVVEVGGYSCSTPLIIQRFDGDMVTAEAKAPLLFTVLEEGETVRDPPKTVAATINVSRLKWEPLEPFFAIIEEEPGTEQNRLFDY